MAEYIDREAFKKSVEEHYCKPCKAEGKDHNGCWCRACWVDDMLDEVDCFRLADVAPVVHGRWISPRRELPPDGEEVLVLTQSKKGIRSIDKGYWAIDHFVHRGIAQVIGWMRLPDMYLSEEEQNED